jgi:hypothetical protein
MAQSKVKTSRLVTLYKKFGSVLAVTQHTSLSYMAVRVRLIKAGLVKGKTFSDYAKSKK